MRPECSDHFLLMILKQSIKKRGKVQMTSQFSSSMYDSSIISVYNTCPETGFYENLKYKAVRWSVNKGHYNKHLKAKEH